MSQTSRLARIEPVRESPFELFEDFFKEASENTIQDAPTPLNIATVNKAGEILNRTVVLRGRDDKGFIIVTERCSRKFKDMMENPNIAATFVWLYRLPGDPDIFARQVRITGTIAELSEAEIAKFYESEPLFYKIRSKITDCGRPCEWEELKKVHDQMLKDHEAGKLELPQNESYTAMRITPAKFDFYMHKGSDCIGDRVVYERKGDSWVNYHVYA